MKLKCKKCGNENLSFVSVTIQDGKNDLLFTSIGLISIGIFTIGLILTIRALSFYDSISSMDIIDLIQFLSTTIAFIINPLLIAFFCFSFVKLMPYQTHDEIEYVCPCCGSHGTIEELELPKKTPVSTETQTNKENNLDQFW